MERFKKMTLAIAAVAMAAGSVSAQTLKAEIPFAFRVGKQVMQPGSYVVQVLPGFSSNTVTKLANIDTKRSVLAVPVSREDPAKEWIAAGLPKLSFACGEGPCTLLRMWNGEGNALSYHSTRSKDGELHIAEITLRPERAD